MKPIACIYTDFPDKFGVPRQSGLIEELTGKIVFENQFRNPQAIRGIEEFSHLWLLWEFSRNKRAAWSPTVRPPRLGGNKRIGVFATRSPFRPNPIGLSCVRLLNVKIENQGPVLYVAGADLVDQTPIFDIKPYIPFTDCHPEATEGYTAHTRLHTLQVTVDSALLEQLPHNKQTALLKILAEDPRPAYIDDPEREYGITFAGFNIRFCVAEKQLTITNIEPC